MVAGVLVCAAMRGGKPADAEERLLDHPPRLRDVPGGGRQRGLVVANRISREARGSGRAGVLCGRVGLRWTTRYPGPTRSSDDTGRRDSGGRRARMSPDRSPSGRGTDLSRHSSKELVATSVSRCDVAA
jgi:hypothetical protein